jgi:hypothetical protein
VYPKIINEIPVIWEMAANGNWKLAVQFEMTGLARQNFPSDLRVFL